jgi:hypothetical protein
LHEHYGKKRTKNIKTTTGIGGVSNPAGGAALLKKLMEFPAVLTLRASLG